MGPSLLRATVVFFFALAGGLFACHVSAKPQDSVASSAESLTWLLPSKGANAEAIFWDERFDRLLSRSVPKSDIYLGLSSSKDAPPPLINAVREVLGGLDQSLLVTEGRYVMISACRLQSCDEKGFVWIDTVQGIVIGGVVHFYYGAQSPSGRSLLLWSNRTIESLPVSFLRDFSVWNSSWLSGAAALEKALAPSVPLDENGYAKIRLVEPGGRVLDLSGTFQPVNGK